MAGRQWEFQTSLIMTELLYLTENYKEYIEKSDLVKRTTKTKITNVTNQFIEYHQENSYQTMRTGLLNIGNRDILQLLVNNTVTEEQKEALGMFFDSCSKVLQEYDNTRVTVTHYLSRVENDIACKVRNLMTAFISNRNKVLVCKRIAAEAQKEAKKDE